MSKRVIVVAAVVLIASTLASPAVRTSQAAAAPAPLTIALITSETGPAGPIDLGTAGAFKARLDLQNAHGGVNGHKLVPLVIDDETSPTEISVAIREAISRGVIGIVSESPLFFLGAKYAEEAGVPVTGDDSDGPEWGEKPYTNMFASVYGSLNPNYPVNTLYGKILKNYGGTTLATYAIGISPDSVRANSDVEQAFDRLGGHTAVNDTSVPFGSLDFTTAAIIAKQKGVNALWPNLDSSSDIALAEAYLDAGIKLKVDALPAGLSPSIVHSPAWPELKGTIFLDEVHPFQLPDAGTREMQAALEKYDQFSATDFPTFSQANGWLGADLMIEGIERAGSNPTRSGVVRGIRSIKDYNGDGLLANNINFSTVFGHDLPICVWLLRAERTGFVPTQSTPVCGADIPGTKASS